MATRSPGNMPKFSVSRNISKKYQTHNVFIFEDWATDSSTLYGGSQGSLYCEAGAPEASSVVSARRIATAVFFCFLFLAASSGTGG